MQLLPFAATALVIELTPGPNMVWLALLAATEGRRPALAAVAGVALGLAAMGGLLSLGIGALIETRPALLAVMRWAGVGFLLWLAWESWRDAGRPAHHQPGGGETPAQAFVRGLLTNLLNPKAALFFLLILPGFLPAGAGRAEGAVLAAVYVGIATAIHLAVVAAAATAGRLAANPAISARLHRVGAATLLLMALWVAVET